MKIPCGKTSALCLIVAGGFLIAVLVCTVYSPACYQCADCNVIIISIDTLRPDHLHCYGYDRNTSPNTDLLAADGVLFRTAIAQAPSTLPSHASMLTALIPSHHGAFHNASSRVPESIPTMAEFLSADGFTTASFNGGGQMSAVYGLSQGFDHYESVKGETFSKVVDRGMEWLGSHRDERCFLFLHTYEVHAPYRSKKEYLDRFDSGYVGSLPDSISNSVLDRINFGDLEIDSEDLAHIRNAYDAGIFTMDLSLGRLVHFLRSEGLYENTILILTSDHGEEFGEHGKVGYHCHTVYDELLRVPLIIKFGSSDFSSTVVENQVRSIDILPTILDVLDISTISKYDGASLMSQVSAAAQGIALPKRDSGRQFAVSERDDIDDIHNIMSIRSADSKLYVIKKDGVVAKRMFFDLAADPGEKKNLVRRNRRTADLLWTQFQAIVDSMECPPLERVNIDVETEERLKKLGYAG